MFKKLEKKVDLYLIQEHWLFDCQLDLLNELHNDYIGIGKAIDSNDPIPPIQMPRGYGGVAILWRKELDSLITPKKIGNERIQCVEIEGNPNTLVVSLYLPCRGSNNHFSELCECMDQLHEILETYESTHHIIIGGDFNENILSSTHSNRKNYITSFMNDHQLLSKEIGITYMHPSGNASSAIDYILYDKTNKDIILKISRLESTTNVSDHIPVLLKLRQPKPSKHLQTPSAVNSNKINWNKIDKEKYKSIIDEMLPVNRKQPENKSEVEKVYTALNQVFLKATQEVAPKKKYKKKKPKLQIMSDKILTAIKRKKEAFHLWKTNGRPKNSDNTYTIKKKNTTIELRKQCRLEIAEKRIQERQNIINARSGDSTLFYKLIKQQRGKLSRFLEELQVDDQSFHSHDNIMSGWNKHFGQLAQKSEYEKFDNKYIELIEKETEIISQICEENFIHKEVTIKEVNTAIKQLNTSKAHDYFGLTAENFIHASNRLIEHLKQLIDLSFQFCHIPDILKIEHCSQYSKTKVTLKTQEITEVLPSRLLIRK